MRLAWLSNSPYANTGYGNQTRVFVPRLQQRLGHAMAVVAYYGQEVGFGQYPAGDAFIPIYPKGHHPYGLDVAAAHAHDHKADALLSLMDVWVVEPRMFGQMRYIPWFPIDMEPLAPPIRDRIVQAFDRIVFSRFGERVVNEGLERDGLTCHYVPHGVDTTQFRPIERSEARTRLGLPQDAFIVGMVAANKGNPSRKAFYQQISAFKQLKDAHPDALLYLHTTKGEHGEYQGVNLPEFAQHIGLRLGEDVIFTQPYSLLLGPADEFMAHLYSAFDVLTNVSMGEGFGVPILESQACGTPVIVGDWTAMPEVGMTGWKVAKEDATPVWTPLAAWQYDPHVGAIAECMEAAYTAARDPLLKATARRLAFETYDADMVTERYWRPVLAEIEANLHERPQSFAVAQAQHVTGEDVVLSGGGNPALTDAMAKRGLAPLRPNKRRRKGEAA